MVTRASLLAVVIWAALGYASASSVSHFPSFEEVRGTPYKVAYDKRSLRINDQPVMFLSGSVHPPRSSVGTWDGIIQRAKSNGLNMIEVYVFWNYHEPLEGQYVWNGRGNLTLFVEKCAQNGMFVNLRIGPYVCAEWDYGGIPAWVGLKKGIVLRWLNPVWQHYMQQWFDTVIAKLKPYFAQYGGPIVLVQVENEFHGTSPEATAYVAWCGDMANKAVANHPVPIIMCNGESANNTINTCNGNDCTGFIEENGQSGRILKDQPALWTENEGGFQVWGGSPSNPTSYFWGRSAANIAYAIARWFARGGSHMNYYMYYGGNNMGIFPGAGVVTMYASDVNICPNTLPHQPKFDHLGNLHKTLASFADQIVTSAAQLRNEIHLEWYDNSTKQWKNGTQQLAWVYGMDSHAQVVFIESSASVPVLTRYQGHTFDMQPSSVIIVDSSWNVVYDTADVKPATTHQKATPFGSSPLKWSVWAEPLSPAETAQFPSLFADHPYEQLNVTKGLTQYMFYERNVSVALDRTAGTSVPFTVDTRKANGLSIFADGVMKGSVEDHSHDNGGDIQKSVRLDIGAGAHYLLILSASFGASNGLSPPAAPKAKGIVGKVTINNQDITTGNWRMRPNLAGQVLEVFTAAGGSKVSWNTDYHSAVGQPLVWFKTQFPTPVVGDNMAVMVNLTGMNRGHAYVNGHDIGRYWLYPMNDGSGRYTQDLYYIPTDWLVAPAGSPNNLVLGEVMGATNPDLAHVVTVSVANGAPPPPPSQDGSIDTCRIA